MRNVFMATIAALAISTSAVLAADLAGEISVEMTENNAGDYVATPTIELSFGHKADGATAFGGVGVEAVNGNLAVDTWNVGVAFGGTSLSFGDQGDLFSFGGLEVVGGDTLADVADDHESLIIGHGKFAALVGFTDISANVGDIENIQLAYEGEAASVSYNATVDYNLNTEDFVVGAAANANMFETVDAGLAVTYADLFAYEATAGYKSVTAFVNGDEDDVLQNIGAGVVYTKDSLSAFAEVGYNLDTEETTPAVGVSFNF
jgi:hypothetical protein